MYLYTKNFLSQRYIHVLINGVRSHIQPVPGGVPRGSVIAPVLFLIAINTLFETIPDNIKTLIYADDILLLSISPFPIMARRRIQQAVDLVAEWAPKIGFQFSPKKSTLLHLGPNRKKIKKLQPLTMSSETIPLARSTRLLGVWIDDRLNFLCHLNNIRKNTVNKINILRIMTNKTSLAHRDSLFRFLHGWLIPSALQWIGTVSLATDEVIKKVEPLYNDCVRIISSAFRSSPIQSLMAESGQLPFIYLLTKHLSLKAIRALANGGSRDTPLVERTNTLLVKLIGEPLPAICTSNGPSIKYWNDTNPKVDLSLGKVIKAGKASAIVLPHFYQLVQDKYSNSPHIYTDGSKTADGKVGCGIHDGICNRSLPLQGQCSVFSSEAYAILDAVQKSTTDTVIFSDSASVLSALAAGNLKHPWIQSIFHLAPIKNITLCWIPGHSDTPGNDSADRLASAGSKITPPTIPVPQSDATRTTKN
ncbi:uncharacterized protein LOC129742184 [Uranotaenia lowii]|uniref:uncharacterized protein LOC129742184 n=1 Tax=Uranotaenia lowii TaxID=190385 RepID=UPI0024786F37|nr:uncharacterized protein LOC129742184 [Uranotaenia lowii]